MAAPIPKSEGNSQNKLTLRFDSTGDRLPSIPNLGPFIITLDPAQETLVGVIKELISRHSGIPYAHLLLLRERGTIFEDLEVLTGQQVLGKTLFFKIRPPEEIEKERQRLDLAEVETTLARLNEKISELRRQQQCYLLSDPDLSAPPDLSKVIHSLVQQQDAYSRRKEQLTKELEH